MEIPNIVALFLHRKLEAEDATCGRLGEEVLGHTHTLLDNYRWSHSTQIGITGQMEYSRNILLHSPRIGRAQSLPKGEVLRHQLRSEDTHQQVGQCSTARWT